MLDFHSHILPGLDDGAPDLETALEMARIAVKDGIKKMVATPHFIEGSMENNRETILIAVAEFQKELNLKNIPLTILPGAEIYLAPDTPDLLKKGEIMTVNNMGKYILIELPMQSIPQYTEDTLFELRLQEVVPIIAHPERNLELGRKPELILEMVTKGCLLQINSGSLTGVYGEKVRNIAKFLVANDLIHLVGSDAHTTGRRSPVVCKSLEVIEGVNPGKVKEINKYAEFILNAKDINPHIPSSIHGLKRGFWERLKTII